MLQVAMEIVGIQWLCSLENFVILIFIIITFIIIIY